MKCIGLCSKFLEKCFIIIIRWCFCNTCKLIAMFTMFPRFSIMCEVESLELCFCYFYQYNISQVHIKRNKEVAYKPLLSHSKLLIVVNYIYSIFLSISYANRITKGNIEKST